MNTAEAVALYRAEKAKRATPGRPEPDVTMHDWWATPRIPILTREDGVFCASDGGYRVPRIA